MKIAIIYNKDMTGVINVFGMQNKEKYNPKTVKLVSDALEKGGHNIAVIDGNMNVVENLQAFMPKVLDGERLGMVFNMAYGIQGESRYTHIPSMLEMLGIPYVGSSPSGHALALDKVITKIIMQKHNIPTPDFWVFSSSEEDVGKVKFPAIVKPKMESVSFGLKVVNDEESLREAIDFVVTEFSQQALVEQFVRGREFAVGLVGNAPVETFPVLEIDLGKDPDAIQSVDDKKFQPREKICPADISPELAEEMKRQSIAAFNALQLRDFARVDIRLDENNNIYLLEVNSMASLGISGSYVYAAKAHGYDYDSLVNKMLDVAVVRYFANSNLLPELNNKPNKLPLHIRVRGYLRSKQENAEKMLQKMTDINTHVKNIEGVNQFANMIKKQFTALDFGRQIIPQIEVGHSVFFSNSDDDNYDVLVLGHLDNGIKINKQDYFHESGQKLFGSGIWQHKGGIVVMLLALQALKFVRVLKKLKIGVLLTGDDFLQGKFSRSTVIEKAARTNYIIGLHGAGINGGLVTSRSGSAVYKCIMNLRKTDDSRDVAKAINLFSRLLVAWTDLGAKEEGIVISPSEALINSNITDPYAHGEVTLSVRFNDEAQFKLIDGKIRKAVPHKYKDIIHFQMEGGERRPAMKFTEKNEIFWQRVQELSNQLDVRLTKEHRWSSADIGVIGGDKYLLDGFGPVGIKEYKKSEYILRHSILERASLLAMTLNELGS
jgi:D-alanine-D-alanine ligase